MTKEYKYMTKGFLALTEEIGKPIRDYTNIDPNICMFYCTKCEQMRTETHGRICSRCHKKTTVA